MLIQNPVKRVSSPTVTLMNLSKNLRGVITCIPLLHTSDFQNSVIKKKSGGWEREICNIGSNIQDPRNVVWFLLIWDLCVCFCFGLGFVLHFCWGGGFLFVCFGWVMTDNGERWVQRKQNDENYVYETI